MGELHPLPVPEGKWKSVTMDHITGLPVSKGFDSILVIVDRFTKRAHFVPCRKDDDTHALASIFVNKWVRLHGYPKDLLTDRGALFTSRFWRDVCKITGMNQRL
jgi:hypothetical protein